MPAPLRPANRLSRARGIESSTYAERDALRLLALCLLCGTLPTRHLAAQERTALHGAVIDRLVTNRPLAGARVTVEGADRTALTDSVGRFVLDSLVPGEYDLLVSHPAFDAAGLSLPPTRVRVRTGIAPFIYETPAGDRVAGRLCDTGASPELSGVVIGAVRDAAGFAPLADVHVAAEWTVYGFTVGKGARRTEQVERRDARTDGDGRFVLCGVPVDVPLQVTAMAPDGSAAGPVVIELAGRPLAVQPVLLSPPASAAASPAELVGVVRSATGAPIEAATVALAFDSVTTATDAEGRYVLSLPRAGSWTLEVRAIGYEPTRRVVGARTGRTAVPAVALKAVTQRLDEISVVADATGFERRRRGKVGQFLTAADIQRMKPDQSEDIVRLATGALTPAGRGRPQYVLLKGGRCTPMIFIDGRPINGVPVTSGETPGGAATGLAALQRPSGLDVGRPDYVLPLDVDPAQIRGVEIYDRSQTIPAEIVAQLFLTIPDFHLLQEKGCAVFFWTYRFQRAPQVLPSDN